MSDQIEFDDIKQKIAGYREDMVELQRQLVCRVAVGPDNDGPGEREKADYLAGVLQTLGLEVKDYPAPDERVAGGKRPNLVAMLPGKRSEKIWILSHLDVVPLGELDLWQSDPFSLRVEGDLLYGRGTEDNHHGIVISLFAARALLEAGITPSRTIALALVSDEETGSLKGLGHLLENQPELFSPQDLIIVPDAGNTEGTLIEVAEKSLLWLRLEIQGRQCHASKPHLGVNTLRACSHLIVALESLGLEFGQQDHFFCPPYSTFEPTKKEANVPNVNTIPGQDIFYLDCRVLPVYGLNLVKARIRALADDIEQRFGVRIVMESIQEMQSPPSTAAEAPVVQALTRAINIVYERQAIPQGIGGATVAAFFRRVGLPAAVWMSVNETAHQPNEHCNLRRLIGDCQVLAHIFLNED